MPRYRTMYGRGAYASPEYRRWLRRRVQPLLARYGLDGGARTAPSDEAGSTGFPDGSLPRGVPGRRRGSAVAAVAAAPTQA
ncbi:hypothetical protein GCM10025868_04170 [Angustibacter aerolatus]|uniref:Uncharacterized protein n=1 Tax=Angustibacter aerolatus TaxID=1162965 RepID=A0ABQ6JAF5_9ACTN|nr:hypothetical protein GCM10025868_04170 [Angustibacter aerolatus]